ncbi:MAG: HAD hydrolase family protein [Planctomycetota bacterium]
MTSRYDLLAIDLDGTLLDSTGTVPLAHAEAVERARKAGLEVTLCTGRALAESAEAIAAVGQRTPVVVAGGAMVCDPVTGSTLHRATMPQAMARPLVEAMHLAGHAALVYKDRELAGYDYLVVTGDEDFGLDPVTEWWFDFQDVGVRTVRSMDEDDSAEANIRVGVCAPQLGADRVDAAVRAMVGRGELDEVSSHAFMVVTASEKAGASEPYVIYECLTIEAHKWHGLRRLCAHLGLDASRVAAIGDQMNDLPMLQHAALGVAMGNAPDEVKAVADKETAGNNDSGVAVAIDRILSGEW